MWESAVGRNNQEDGDGNNDDGPYSGSTITPPTPSKHNDATLPFGDLDCVVSIEPNMFLEEGNEDGRYGSYVIESGDKRHRGINIDDEEDDRGVIQRGQCFRRRGTPAFFAGSINKCADTGDNKHVDDGIGGTKVDSYSRDQINSDPSLCTFQAAIVKEDAIALISNHPEESGKTPTDHHDRMIEIQESKRKALLFRFGHRFVFRVNESAIVEISYEPGSAIEDEAAMDSKDGCDATIESPLSKRRKLDSGYTSSTAENGISARMTTTRQLPPCVLISFNTCSFRVFSLDRRNVRSSKTVNCTLEESNRPSSRIWNTLKPDEAESAIEDMLMNARSDLLQHFDIENNQRRVSLGCSISWKMATPGPGAVFHTWPEECETGNFLSEGWACCLDEGRKSPSSITTSPHKSGSPSKSSGSSTHFEHGQKEQVPTTSSSQSHSTATAVENGISVEYQHEEKTGKSDHLSSDLSHVNDDEGKPQANQYSSLHELGGDRVVMEKANNIERNMEINKGIDFRRIDDVEIPRGDTEQHDDQQQQQQTLQQLWKDKVYTKYKSFENSATHMNKAIESTTLAVSSHHLTSCAESLSDSYLSMSQFTMRSQECEDDIDRITTELESVLDMMFPARGGRKSNEALTCEKSDEIQGKIAELMLLRKEAVAAKFSILLIPKR